MTVLAAETAPAKINLCLFLGPLRRDGRHELVTVFDALTLGDELEVAAGNADAVVCEGVLGPNLVSEALSALRAAGWEAPPVTVRIAKRIPVAAGMGGGSADAAAMLRLAPRLAPVEAPRLAEIAAQLGSDVPAQLDPGPCIATGAGDVLEPLPELPAYGILVLAQPFPLSTASVYHAADRLGLPRSAGELGQLHAGLAAALPGALPADLIVNDLQPAAVSLAPPISDAVSTARHAGADHALVCGSGPTVIGVYRGADGIERAAAAAAALPETVLRPVVAAPVGRGVARRTANE